MGWCGRPAILNNMGLCNECNRELVDKLRNDDNSKIDCK